MVKVSVKGLVKNFGRLEVLKGVDLDVSEGEVVSVIGPSGSGKSTFLRCINALEVPTSGTIEVDGMTVTKKHADINRIRENIGMVFQQFNLFPHLSVLDNIMMAPIDRKRMTKEDARDKANELLARVGLSERRTCIPASFRAVSSSGSRSRARLRCVPISCSLTSRRARLTPRW